MIVKIINIENLKEEIIYNVYHINIIQDFISIRFSPDIHRNIEKKGKLIRCYNDEDKEWVEK